MKRFEIINILLSVFCMNGCAMRVNYRIVSVVNDALTNPIPSLSYNGSLYQYVPNEPIAIAPATLAAGLGVSIGNCVLDPSSPSLPVGVSIQSSDCSISGSSPIDVADTTYIVRVSNSFGNSITATVRIEIATPLPQWYHNILVQNFSPTDSLASTSPVIATNSTGAAIAVWVQSDGSVQRIYKAEKTAGGSWTFPANLSDAVSLGIGSNSPAVAINDNNEAVIAWVQYGGTEDRILKAERSAAGVWTLPTSIADTISPLGQNAVSPSVALSANGNAIIVWNQSDGSNYQAFKAEKVSGTWSTPANLTDNVSPNGQDVNDPISISINSTGDVVMGWYQSDGSSYQAFKAEKVSGTWSIPANLADNVSPDGQEVYMTKKSVALNDSGEAILTWYQYDGANNQIFKAERASNGTWSVPGSLADNISTDLFNANDPVVSLNNVGQAVLAWNQSDGSNYQIFKAERNSLGVWSFPVDELDNISPNGQNTSLPDISLNLSGETILSWIQSDGSKQQVFKSERASNGLWTHPSSLADKLSVNGEDVESTRVSLSTNSEAVVLFSQSDGSSTQIFMATRAAGGAWTVPSGLSNHISLPGFNAFGSVLAVNQNGEAVMAWVQNDGSRNQIYKAERSSSGVWSKPANLADHISPSGANASEITVAMNDNGQAVIAWKQIVGGNVNIFKAERATNGTWTVPTNLADYISANGASGSSPAVAINSTGEVVLVWYQSDGSNPQIYKAERASNGVWTRPANLADNISPNGTNAYVSGSVVALNDSGQAIITWTQRDGASTSQIFKAERASNGVWTIPSSNSDNISADGYEGTYPTVSLNSSGQAIIAWYQDDGLNHQIYKAERASNGVWTYPSGLADHLSPSGTDAYGVQISMNDAGKAVATWYQSDGSDSQIFVAERAASGVWTTPSNASDNISPDGQASYSSNVSLNASGQAIVSWIQSDGTNMQIFKAVRSALGAWTLPLITEGVFAGISNPVVILSNFTFTSQVEINDNGLMMLGYTSSTYSAAVSEFK